ncbi:MAG: C-glycoside deglycosidase beta subunit domain-containing protein [Christensenellales bacterium]|jgi:hypothetical protein
MIGRKYFNPNAFMNVLRDGEIIGYSFEIKAQYYRSFTLSILRDIKVVVDGKTADREDVRLTVNEEMFTLDECRTVIDPEYRWEFGEFATVTVMKKGGLTPGKHHIDCHQSIAPSYMPFTVEADCSADFEI